MTRKPVLWGAARDARDAPPAVEPLSVAPVPDGLKLSSEALEVLARKQPRPYRLHEPVNSLFPGVTLQTKKPPGL